MFLLFQSGSLRVALFGVKDAFGVCPWSGRFRYLKRYASGVWMPLVYAYGAGDFGVCLWCGRLVYAFWCGCMPLVYAKDAFGVCLLVYAFGLCF